MSYHATYAVPLYYTIPGYIILYIPIIASLKPIQVMAIVMVIATVMGTVSEIHDEDKLYESLDDCPIQLKHAWCYSNRKANNFICIFWQETH